MKKLLQAASVFALLYGLFLLIDGFRSKPDEPSVASRSELGLDQLSPTPPLEIQNQTWELPKREARRKSLFQKSKGQAQPESAMEAAQGERAEEAFVEKMNSEPIALPQAQPRSWETHQLASEGGRCPAERDCTPRGRDGVLMVGGSFVASQPVNQWQGRWQVGNAAEQTALVHIK